MNFRVSGVSVLLGIALIVCVAILVRTYWLVYSIGGWKDEVYVLSGYKGTSAALDDFHYGRLRVFELDGPHDMPQFSGRRDGDFEIWYPQFFATGEANRYATEQFVEFYNRKMRYAYKHPEPPKQDAFKKDLDAIQGTWKIVALEADGKQAPAEIVAALKLTFKGDTLTFTPGEPGFSNYNYKLDPTTKPASFDMTHADGDNKGDTQKGIYSLVGNHLKICFGRADNRPKEFTTTANSGRALYSLEREKP